MRAATAAVALALSLAACEGTPTIQPSTRYATAAAVVDGTVYIAGGLERGRLQDSTVGTLEAYDPGDRKWIRCAPMPTPRCFAAAAAFDGKVYVFGGLDAAGKAVDVAEAYDPGADSWSPLPSIGAARSRLAAVRRRDHGILVVGGMDASEKNTDKARIFMPTPVIRNERDTWAEWVDLPSPRHGLCIVDAADDTERVFAVGGYGEEGPLATVEVFGVGTVKVRREDGTLRWPGATGTDNRTGKVTPIDKDYQGYGWRPGPPLREARGFFGLAAIGRRLYAVGGRLPSVPRTEVLDMDDPYAGWRPASPLPKDLCRFSMVEWKGHLLVFGGETDSGQAVNADVLEYDPDADRWTVR